MSKVQQGKTEGTPVAKVLKKEGVAVTSYYKWLKENGRGKKKTAPQLVTMHLDQEDEQPTFMFYGRAKDLTHALDRIAEINRNQK